MSRTKGYITRQTQRLSDGTINRRRFVMSALSAGVALPTAMSLASKVDAAVPKAGGHFRIALAGSLTENRHKTGVASSFDNLFAFASGNALTEIDTTGDVIGELAAQFESSDAGRTWHFKLRENVVFHNGQALTNHDVAKSLQQHTGSGDLLSDLEQLELSGEDEIKLTFANADPALPRRLADPRLIVLTADKSGLSVGTGPYKPLERPHNDSALLERNDAYWKDGRGHFESVEISVFHDVVARQRAVMTGDVDYADMIDPRMLELLRRTPTLNILETHGTRHLTLATRQRGRELQQQVPERAILEQVLLGHGQIAKNDTLSSGKSNTRPAVQSHDMPIRIGLRDGHLPGLKEAAQLIVSESKKSDINVEITTDPVASNEAEIGWARSSADTNDIVIWANDLVAHRNTLRHGPTVGIDLENDNARIAERWWFG